MSYKKAEYKVHSRIMTSFLTIPPTKYLQKIHYFERKENQIQSLPQSEQYVLYTCYADALFNLRVFSKYLAYNHQVLAMSLDPEIEDDEGVFRKLLSKKARALFGLGSYQECTYICKELLRMNNDQNYIPKLFVSAQKRIERDKNHRFKAILIIFISTASIVYFVKSIFLSAFYPELEKMFNIILAVLLALVVLQLVWNEWMVRVRARNALANFMTELQ